jgi:hypothetical protein
MTASQAAHRKARSLSHAVRIARRFSYGSGRNMLKWTVYNMFMRKGSTVDRKESVPRPLLGASQSDRLQDRPPLGGLGFDIALGLGGGRRLDWYQTHIGNPLPHIGIAHDALHLGIQTADNRLWSAGAHDKRVPRQDFKIGHAGCFRERRHVGQRGQSLPGRDCESTELAGLDQRTRRPRLGKGKGHVSGGDILNRLWAVLVRDVRELESKPLFDQFDHVVWNAASRR